MAYNSYNKGGSTWNVRKPPASSRNEEAKKGLEQKMAYWRDKDYQYEFGVTLGQAVNLSISNLANETDEEVLSKVLRIFKLGLRAKLDPVFIRVFDEYYSAKKTSLDRPVAKQELSTELGLDEIQIVD
jgi:hypothetical protein